MEVAGAHMALDPMLAPDLKVSQPCLDLLALPVSEFWRGELLPPQLTCFHVDHKQTCLIWCPPGVWRLGLQKRGRGQLQAG
jgi:hypothetical protein